MGYLGPANNILGGSFKLILVVVVIVVAIDHNIEIVSMVKF